MTAKKHPYNQYSPDSRALDVVGDKWALLIVRELLNGPVRHNELRDLLPGISTESLRTRLNELVDNGLATRRHYRSFPRRTDYELTSKGRDLLDVLAALAGWGMVHCAEPPHEGEADADGSAARRFADALDAAGLPTNGSAVRWFANRGSGSEAVAA